MGKRRDNAGVQKRHWTDLGNAGLLKSTKMTPDITTGIGIGSCGGMKDGKPTPMGGPRADPT